MYIVLLYLLDISPFSGGGCRIGGDDCLFSFTASEVSSTELLDFIGSVRLIVSAMLSGFVLFSGELATVWRGKGSKFSAFGGKRKQRDDERG